MNVNLGLTFEWRDSSGKEHLYVVISKPENHAVLVVNITTQNRFSDTSCILQPGDHPFIRHESCIAWGRAGLWQCGCVISELDNNNAVRRADMPHPAMQKIWDGAELSKNLADKHKVLLARQNIIDKRFLAA